MYCKDLNDLKSEHQVGSTQTDFSKSIGAFLDLKAWRISPRTVTRYSTLLAPY
jgi:hypothetical protein